MKRSFDHIIFIAFPIQDHYICIFYKKYAAQRKCLKEKWLIRNVGYIYLFHLTPLLLSLPKNHHNQKVHKNEVRVYELLKNAKKLKNE